LKNSAPSKLALRAGIGWKRPRRGSSRNHSLPPRFAAPARRRAGPRRGRFLDVARMGKHRHSFTNPKRQRGPTAVRPRSRFGLVFVGRPATGRIPPRAVYPMWSAWGNTDTPSRTRRAGEGLPRCALARASGSCSSGDRGREGGRHEVTRLRFVLVNPALARVAARGFWLTHPRRAGKLAASRGGSSSRPPCRGVPPRPSLPRRTLPRARCSFAPARRPCLGLSRPMSPRHGRRAGAR
jgi:hypothetical protein